MNTETPKRILIVEDTQIMADVLKRNIVRAGMDPIVARNGVEGLEFVQKHRFDLIITDYQMPRMNGDEFVRNLRMTPLNCDTPVIFVSGKGLEVDTEKMKNELGIYTFIFKPFSPSELVTQVQQCFASASQSVKV